MTDAAVGDERLQKIFDRSFWVVRMEHELEALTRWFLRRNHAGAFA